MDTKNRLSIFTMAVLCCLFAKGLRAMQPSKSVAELRARYEGKVGTIRGEVDKERREKERAVAYKLRSSLFDAFRNNDLAKDAFRNNDLAKVEALIKQGADIEAADEYGWRAIHFAADIGNEASVKLLLEKGADIEAVDEYGWRAIHIAVVRRKEAIVKLLLEKGADKEAATSNGKRAIHFAVGSGKEAIVKLLLEKGADIEAEDESGWRAIHRAIESGQEAIVKLLLEKGADIEAATSNGKRAIHIAADRGNEAIVKLLLEAGVKIDDVNKFYEAEVQRLFVLAREVDDAVKKADAITGLMANSQRIKSKLEFIKEKQKILAGGAALPASGANLIQNQKDFLLVLRRMLSMAIDTNNFELVKGIIQGGFVQNLNAYSSQIIRSLAKAIKEKDVKQFNNSIFAKIFRTKFEVGQNIVIGKNFKVAGKIVDGVDLLKEIFVLRVQGRGARQEPLTVGELRDCAKFAAKVAKYVYVTIPKGFIEKEAMYKELGKKHEGESKPLSDVNVIVSKV